MILEKHSLPNGTITESVLLEIIKKNFPLATGIILTGSQSYNTVFSSVTDVDVVIFDFEISVVSQSKIQYRQLIIDATLVPLYDIENVLFNESFHQKGTLLSMISKGEIIKDTIHRIISLIQDKAQKLYSQRGAPVNRSYQEAFKNLSSLSKDFKKKLSFEERFILINNFIYFITQLELCKNSNWLHSGKHRAKFVSDSSNAMITQVIELSKFHMFNKSEDDLIPIKDYILYYLENSEMKENDQKNDDRYVIDLSYPKISVVHFLSTALNAILKNHILKENYLYFFTSPAQQLHRLFLNNISIVFKVDSVDKRKEIYRAFNDVFVRELKKEVKVKNNGTYVYSNRNHNQEVYYDFEPVAIAINAMFKNQISSNKPCDVDRNLNIGIILCSFILKCLAIEVQDIVKILTYLLQRHILDYDEQMNLKDYSSLVAYRKGKNQIHHLFFEKNKDALTNMFNKGLSYTKIGNTDTEKEYSEVIMNLKEFLNIQGKKQEQIITNNPITSEILTHDCKTTETNKALIFVLTFEQLSLVMNFDAQQKGLLLYTMIALVNEFKYIISSPSP